MAGTQVEAAPNVVARTIGKTQQFLVEVAHEWKKITWPDREQLRSMTISIIIFVLLIGAFIALLDLSLNLILVKLIPSLFKR